MSNRHPRPSTSGRQQMEDTKEDLFTVTVHFRDDDETITVDGVGESDVVGIYEVLGEATGRVRFTTSPGIVYLSAASRVKYITATKEEAN